MFVNPSEILAEASMPAGTENMSWFRVEGLGCSVGFRVAQVIIMVIVVVNNNKIIFSVGFSTTPRLWLFSVLDTDITISDRQTDRQRQRQRRRQSDRDRDVV